jgi:CBS domain-containing protein
LILGILYRDNRKHHDICSVHFEPDRYRRRRFFSDAGKKVRNHPVVDASGSFIGLFGLRRIGRLLLPKVALDLGRHSISELHFLPDEVVQDSDRWREISEQPVANFLEKKKKLLFCTPQTALPELLALLDKSKDSSLPVIVIEGEAKKVVGMVSSWDVLQAIVMGRLIKANDSAAH